MGTTMRDLLMIAVEREATDLHVTTGTYPQLRCRGELAPLSELTILGPEDTRRLVSEILTPARAQVLEAKHQVDFAFAIDDHVRCRVNVYEQRAGLAAAIRLLPLKIRSFEELGLPPVVQQLAERPRGLVLVTGSTGCGKTTTLAAMIDRINTERAGHILTIEDPVEYVHTHKRCVVNQREVGAHVPSFAEALRSAMRQNPDVILLGEMRDPETIHAALTLAEMGHLVFGTLHTNSAPQTISRVVSAFPAHQQSQVAMQLSLVLEGVLTQLLLPRIDGPGSVLALEVMVVTPAIRNLIREQHTHQIYSVMQAGGKIGTQTMSQALASLARHGLIAREDALRHSPLPDEVGQLLGGPTPGNPATGPRFLAASGAR
jgi:twitching motility protein PilT